MQTKDIVPGKVYVTSREREPSLSASATLILSSEKHSIGRYQRAGAPYIKRGPGGYGATEGLLGVHLDVPYGSVEVAEVPTFTEEEIEQGRQTGSVPRGETTYHFTVVPARQVHGEFTPTMQRLMDARQALRESRLSEEARKEAGRARQRAAIAQAAALLPEVFSSPESFQDRWGSGSKVELTIQQFEALVAAAQR